MTCSLCGNGPRLPHCDAKIHQSPHERASAPSLSEIVGPEILEDLRSEIQAATAATFPDVLADTDTKSTSTKPDGRGVWLGELLGADYELQQAQLAHEAATAKRLEVIANLRAQGVTVQAIADALGISKAGASQLAKRALRESGDSREVRIPPPTDGAGEG